MAYGVGPGTLVVSTGHVTNLKTEKKEGRKKVQEVAGSSTSLRIRTAVHEAVGRRLPVTPHTGTVMRVGQYPASVSTTPVPRHR
eukprot:1974099-Rhodomonas_salina.1